MDKKNLGTVYEDILSLCAGLRKVPARDSKEIAYNNALGDVFDHILAHHADCLLPGTVTGGKWIRDKGVPNEEKV